MEQHEIISDPPSSRSEIFCGLCKHSLSVPPVQQCVSKKFICGVCFSSKLYYPTDKLENHDQVEHQELFEVYAENDSFPCMYENCEASLKFGSDALNHRQTCSYRSFHCPLSAINKHYLPPDFDEHCEFSSTKPTDLFPHVQKEHPNLIKNKIYVEEFLNHPYKLIVLPYKPFLSVVFVNAVDSQSLLVSCRAYKHDPITDQCVIKIVKYNRKYITKCCNSIGSIRRDFYRSLKNVTSFNGPIKFSIVPMRVLLSDLTADSSDSEEF